MLRIIAIAASLAGALFLAAPAAAAGGKNTGTSSISLLVPAALTSAGAAPAPHYGDLVTFAVETDETTQPWVNLRCYQGRELVSEGYDGFYAGALGDELFGLYSPMWTGGAADCTAALMMRVNGRWKQLASTSFHVNA
jgi:hypothetical protein